MKVIIFFLVLLFVPLLNTIFALIGWFKYKFGEGKGRRCKNCFYNVILPGNRDDYVFVHFQNMIVYIAIRQQQNVLYHMDQNTLGTFNSSDKAGWNCPHWIKRSPNQPEVK
jgi:hypothetical protein